MVKRHALDDWALEQEDCPPELRKAIENRQEPRTYAYDKVEVTITLDAPRRGLRVSDFGDGDPIYYERPFV